MYISVPYDMLNVRKRAGGSYTDIGYTKTLGILCRCPCSGCGRSSREAQRRAAGRRAQSVRRERPRRTRTRAVERARMPVAARFATGARVCPSHSWGGRRRPERERKPYIETNRFKPIKSNWMRWERSDYPIDTCDCEDSRLKPQTVLSCRDMVLAISDEWRSNTRQLPV